MTEDKPKKRKRSGSDPKGVDFYRQEAYSWKKMYGGLKREWREFLSIIKDLAVANGELQLKLSQAEEKLSQAKESLAPTVHQYTSTACQHMVHSECRKVCKFCPAACGCPCHEGEED